jgi:hypothetical protein
MTKVKVFEKKVKDQTVKVMVSNEKFLLPSAT